MGGGGGRTTTGGGGLYSHSRSVNDETSQINENSGPAAALLDIMDECDDIDLTKLLFNDPDELERYERSLLQRPGSRARSVPAFFPPGHNNINEFRSSNQMLPSINLAPVDLSKPINQSRQQQRSSRGGDVSTEQQRVKTAKSSQKNAKYVALKYS